MMDFGCHRIEVLLNLFGAVRETTGLAANVAFDRDVEDTAAVLLRFESGGLPGAVIYEGYGTGRCNCKFIPRYPYAIGPRIGFAYQLDSKTVLRGGWGVVYGNLNTYSYFTNSASLGVGIEQLGENLLGDAEAAGGVLAVHHNEVEAIAFAQKR